MTLSTSDVSMTSNFINMDQEEPHQQVEQQQNKRHHKPEQQQSEGTNENEEQIALFIESLSKKVHTFNHNSFFKVGKTRPNHIAYGKMGKLRVKIISKVHSW